MLRKNFFLFLVFILIIVPGALVLIGCGAPPEEEVQEFQEQLDDFEEEGFEDSILNNHGENNNSES